MLVAWGFDSGWAAVRQLTPSLLRGLVSAGVAAAVALALMDALFGGDALTTWAVLWSAIIGGVTALAAFLVVAYALRSPELRELRRRV